MASLGLLEKAGLLTLSHPQAPSHPFRGSGILPGAIMELTAARQSGTHTPFPLLIAWSEPFECKDNAICPFTKNICHFFRIFVEKHTECPNLNFENFFGRAQDPPLQLHCLPHRHSRVLNGYAVGTCFMHVRLVPTAATGHLAWLKRPRSRYAK